MKKRVFYTLLAVMLFVSGCAEAKQEKEEVPSSKESYQEQMQEAKTTPFGKYPELVTYTLGKMTGVNQSNMPKGDTYENNVYTRYLRKLLNIQNKDTFEAYDVQYNTNVTMRIAEGTLPDVMVVDNYEDLEFLVENDKIEDLTQSYENCASRLIKDIYASYGDSIFDNVTFDGKLMAIPETNITDGPNLLWLRKDWLDKLHLKEPKTIADVETIVKAFIKEHPDNEAGETVGLICNTTLTGDKGFSYEYLLDIVFATYGAFPKQWIEGSDGQAVYGSVQPEAKEALKLLQRWYQEGVLDRDFLLRTSNNLIDLVVEGKCGAFFGPWWAPNNPLLEAKVNNPQADWKPYLIETKTGGVTEYCRQSPSYKYVVVRKGFAYPELVMKQISALFDYGRYGKDATRELEVYFKQNVDPTARPLAINIDYFDALMRCYDGIMEVLYKGRPEDTLPLVEKAYYQACRSYIENGEIADETNWAAYASRVEACALLKEGKIVTKTPVFFGTTKTMNTEWWKLKEKEQKAYLKIITGEKDMTYFEQFVSEWNAEGGQVITNEVRTSIRKKNAAKS